ncbi:unnamed protein product [Urochloa humidicola]
MGVWSILPARYAGDSKSTRFFFFAFLCVGFRFPWGVHFAGCFHDVGFTTGLVTKDTAAGVWRIVSTGGLGFVLPVLLSLQSFFGVGVVSDEGVRDGSVRFVSYSYREESGWSSFAGVALLLDDLESPVVVRAPDLFCLGDEWAFSDPSVHRFHRCANCCQGWFQKYKCGFFRSFFFDELEFGFKLPVRRSFLPGSKRRTAVLDTSNEGHRGCVTSTWMYLFFFQDCSCNF